VYNNKVDDKFEYKIGWLFYKKTYDEFLMEIFPYLNRLHFTKMKQRPIRIIHGHAIK